MAGKITTNSVVLGDSVTDTQNFVLKTNADGTATLARGALGGLGTVFGVNGSGALTGATLVAPALGTPASGVLTNCTGVAKAALPAGSVLQVVNFQTGAVATGTASIPFDNTIPQITEGTQFLSLAITPISATSKLLFQITMQMSTLFGAWCSTALFQDSTTNAIAAGGAYMLTIQGGVLTPLNYFMTSGTTSTTTFTVRFGGDGGQTITVNGQNGARVFGGVASSSITITEIAA